MHEVKLRYSEPLWREAVRAFVLRAIVRSFGIRFFFAFAVLAICIACLILQGDRSWVVGALAAALFFAVFYPLMIYFTFYRITIRRFRRMRVPEATLSYSEDQFTIISEFGSATLPWSSIIDVWRFPRFWLILFSRWRFSPLPLDCLDAETQDFITRKTQHK